MDVFWVIQVALVPWSMISVGLSSYLFRGFSIDLTFAFRLPRWCSWWITCLPLLGFDPWVRKVPWRRAWPPAPVFLPGEFNSKDRGARRITVHGVTGSLTWLSDLPGMHAIIRNHFSFLFLFFFIPYAFRDARLSNWIFNLKICIILVFNWSIIALQGHVRFCCTVKWIGYWHTHIPPLVDTPTPQSHPPGPHRAPSWAPWAIQRGTLPLLREGLCFSLFSFIKTVAVQCSLVCQWFLWLLCFFWKLGVLLLWRGISFYTSLPGSSHVPPCVRIVNYFSVGEKTCCHCMFL